MNQDEIRWLFDEAWELNNKPWRFFNTMANAIEKHGDGSSQDREAIEGLREWAAWVGEGNNPRSAPPKQEKEK